MWTDLSHYVTQKGQLSQQNHNVLAWTHHLEPPGKDILIDCTGLSALRANHQVLGGKIEWLMGRAVLWPRGETLQGRTSALPADGRDPGERCDDKCAWRSVPAAGTKVRQN